MERVIELKEHYRAQRPAADPERAALAAAIERHAAAQARVDRIAAAQAKASELSHAKFLEIEVAAEGCARRCPPRAGPGGSFRPAIERRPGQIPPPPPPTLRRTLNDAASRAEAAAAARETIAAERQPGRFQPWLSPHRPRRGRRRRVAAPSAGIGTIAGRVGRGRTAGMPRCGRPHDGLPRCPATYALTDLQRGLLWDLHVDALTAGPGGDHPAGIACGRGAAIGTPRPRPRRTPPDTQRGRLDAPTHPATRRPPWPRRPSSSWRGADLRFGHIRSHLGETVRTSNHGRPPSRPWRWPQIGEEITYSYEVCSPEDRRRGCGRSCGLDQLRADPRRQAPATPRLFNA